MFKFLLSAFTIFFLAACAPTSVQQTPTSIISTNTPAPIVTAALVSSTATAITTGTPAGETINIVASKDIEAIRANAIDWNFYQSTDWDTQILELYKAGKTPQLGKDAKPVGFQVVQDPAVQNGLSTPLLLSNSDMSGFLANPDTRSIIVVDNGVTKIGIDEYYATTYVWVDADNALKVARRITPRLLADKDIATWVGDITGSDLSRFPVPVTIPDPSNCPTFLGKGYCGYYAEHAERVDQAIAAWGQGSIPEELPVLYYGDKASTKQ